MLGLGRPNDLVLTVGSGFNKHSVHDFHHTAPGSQRVDVGGIDGALGHGWDFILQSAHQIVTQHSFGVHVVLHVVRACRNLHLSSILALQTCLQQSERYF